jgi:probable addiction module antidote protein
MAEKFSRYDTADYLETEEDIRLYLEACQEEGDPALVAAALGDIARARNMSQLAKDVGMTRAGLYKALSPDGNPSFATISKVAKALGLKVTVHPVQAGPAVERYSSR